MERETVCQRLGAVLATVATARLLQSGETFHDGGVVDVFALRDRLVEDYEEFTRSFINVRDPRIDEVVDRELSEGLLWPESLIQLNLSFAQGASIDERLISSNACSNGLEPQGMSSTRRLHSRGSDRRWVRIQRSSRRRTAGNMATAISNSLHSVGPMTLRRTSRRSIT